MKKWIAIGLFVAMSTNVLVASTIWSDNFESSTVKTNWQFYGVGSPRIATNRSGNTHSGNKAFALGTSGGYVQNNAYWDLPTQMYSGRMSWWHYDEAAQNTPYYSGMYVEGSNASIGVWLTDRGWGQQTNGTSSYSFNITFNGITDRGWGTRTIGWHKYEVVLNASQIQLFIDGALARSGVVSNGINRVRFYHYGGSVSLFDDLTIEDDTVYVALAISSAHGITAPTAGQNFYLLGASITCSVPSSVIEQGINWRNTGWTGTGDVPASGNTNTTGAILLTNISSSITWNWIQNSSLSVSNVTVSQRSGTKLMDITYDIISDVTNAAPISLVIKNGTTNIPSTNCTGDIGTNVLPSTGRSMVWNMGADWNTNSAVLTYSVMHTTATNLYASTTAPSDSRNYTLTVASAHGTPSPSIGTHLYALGTVVTCSVPSSVIERGVNWRNMGWTGTGDIPATGPTNTTGAILLTNISSSITWNWQTSFAITNVVATQRAGTKLVDITYDIISDVTNAVPIYLRIQNGTTNIPNTNRTGDIGTNVLSGTGRHIVWDAGADHPNNFNSLIFTVCSFPTSTTTNSLMLKNWSTDQGGNGNFYEAVLGSITWTNAYQDAQKKLYLGAQGHLATLTTASEDIFVYQAFSTLHCTGLLLGGYQKSKINEPSGNWAWVTGEEWSYANWALGEPNNLSNNEEVLQYWEQGPLWNDSNSFTPFGGYLVEYEANDIYPDFPQFFASYESVVDTRGYTLTVNNGSGNGLFTNGMQVVISANAPAVGKAFDRWMGDTQYVASVTSSTTTVTMPTQEVSLTAMYVDVYYPLTVNNGSGAGSYTNGTWVTIAANVQPGQAFTRWTGVTEYVASITSSTTIVTMPAWDISLTATYGTDSTKPTLTIVTPITKARILATNGLFTVRGTAADNKLVTNVLVQLNSGSWTNAGTTNGWKNWSLPVMLTSGTNIIRAYSVDSAVNNSITATVACTYVITGTLNIQTNGGGTVTRTPVGEPEVGQPYTLTAAAKTGFVFSSWTGDLPSTNKMIAFTMSTNKTVIANFTDIAKPTIAITAPTALQKVFGTNGDFIVRGTALDNWALSNVMVSVNNGSFVPASTTTNIWKNWSLPVTLLSSINGVTNTIAAYSVDTTGNTSATVTMKCVYTETGSLTITTNGPGKVTVTPTGPLLLNKTYTLTAAANAGGVFSNWVGKVVGNPTGKVVTVTLNGTNKIVAVTANFTDTAKPTVVITYPANNAKVLTNGLVIIRGTATDNDVLKEIKYQRYDGTWTNAVSTNVFKAWTADYVPVAGLNTSKVYSVDAQGNHSSTSQVVFTYIPGAVLTVQTNGNGTITPSLNGKVLQIGSTNTMTAAAKTGYVFTNWTYGIGGSVVTNGKIIKFVMTTNLVLTANFRNLTAGNAMADVLSAPQTIVVDGSSKDWTDVPRSTFSYSSVTQEVAVALDGNNIALLLNGCPFGTSDTVLVYFKLRLSYGVGDDRHTVDLWTSGSVLYGMVDGQVITGLEAVLLNGVLEVKIPVEQSPSQVIIEEVGCGMNLGGGTMLELFKFIAPENPLHQDSKKTGNLPDDGLRHRPEKVLPG